MPSRKSQNLLQGLPACMLSLVACAKDNGMLTGQPKTILCEVVPRGVINAIAFNPLQHG